MMNGSMAHNTRCFTAIEVLQQELSKPKWRVTETVGIIYAL